MLTSNPYCAAQRRAARRHASACRCRASAARCVDDDGRRLRRPARSATSRCAARTCSPATGACPRRREEEFTADGWFKTGDVGQHRRPTATSPIVGRSKDLIISGGYNVYPKEIEGYINEMPGVAESAVVGVPHPDFGEAVVAVVVAQAGRGARCRRDRRRAEGADRQLQGAQARASWSTSCRATRWARCRKPAARAPSRDVCRVIELRGRLRGPTAPG